MNRLTGILGGTFDPVHLGHLHLARQVYSQLGLQQLQFMPCSIPVHRQQPRASASQRCAMLELAIESQPGFELNPLELERGGPSYSIDSLRLIRRDTDATLVLVMGTDAFNGFASWKDPGGILQLAHLVVCHRPGVTPTRDLYQDRLVASSEHLAAAAAGSIMMLEIDANDCSSSGVRELLAAGDTTNRCLDPAIADYIKRHHLYRKTSD